MEKISHRREKTSRAQLEVYISVIANDRRFIDNSFKSKGDRATAWESLVTKLNDCYSGPVLSVIQWKERLRGWKNQLRRTARMEKALRRGKLIGCRAASYKPLGKFSRRALALIDGRTDGVFSKHPSKHRLEYQKTTRNSSPVSSGFMTDSSEADNSVEVSSSSLKSEDVDFNYSLIKAVKACPELYDKRSNNYGRQKYWSKIATDLGVDELECRKRWQTLEGDFFRNIKKSTKMEPKPWKYMEKMNFLLSFTVSSLSNGSSEGKSSNDPQINNDSDEIDISKVKLEGIFAERTAYTEDLDEENDGMENITKTTAAVKRKRDTSSLAINKPYSTNLNGQIDEIGYQCQSCNSQSPIELFFRSLALQVKDFSNSQKLRLQLKCIKAAQIIDRDGDKVIDNDDDD